MELSHIIAASKLNLSFHFMKSILLSTVVFLLVVQGAFARVQKNTLMTGGYANMHIDKNKVMVSLNPNTGIFVTDKICLGLSLPVLYSNSTLSWALSPFGRYYTSPSENKSVFICGAVGVTSFLDLNHALPTNKVNLDLVCLVFESKRWSRGAANGAFRF